MAKKAKKTKTKKVTPKKKTKKKVKVKSRTIAKSATKSQSKTKSIAPHYDTRGSERKPDTNVEIPEDALNDEFQTN